MKNTPKTTVAPQPSFDFTEPEPETVLLSKYMRGKLHMHGPRYNDYARKYPKDSDCRSRIHRVWRCMQMRCLQPSHAAYHRYGGRGITICPEWMQYDTFRLWTLSSGYAEHLTLDRIDNDKGYNPDNCRWLTMKEQNNNRRCSIILTAWGETKPAAEWLKDPRCKFAGTSVHRRLKKGIPPEIALTQKLPKDRSGCRTKTLTAFGETKTLHDWAVDTRCLVELKTLRNRLRREWAPWTDEEIITTPASPNGVRALRST